MKILDLSSAADTRLPHQLGSDGETLLRKLPVEFAADGDSGKTEVRIQHAPAEASVARQLRLSWLAMDANRSAAPCHWGINE